MVGAARARWVVDEKAIVKLAVVDEKAVVAAATAVVAAVKL